MKRRKKRGHKNAGNFRSIRRRYKYGHATVPQSRARWYNVRLHGKLIEEVHFASVWPNKTEREDDVARSLINHDGFDPAIKVTEVRKGR